MFHRGARGGILLGRAFSRRPGSLREAEAPAPAAAPAASPNRPAAGVTGTADSSADDNSMLGSETVTPVTPAQPAAELDTAERGFLNFNEVKLGGQIKGYFEWSPMWSPAWDGSARLFSPASAYITPDLEGRFTITAKPLVDFSVGAHLRTHWPSRPCIRPPSPHVSTALPRAILSRFRNISEYFPSIRSSTGRTRSTPVRAAAPVMGREQGRIPARRRHFRARDSTIDLNEVGREREMGIWILMTVPMSDTNNFYLLAGLPTPTRNRPARPSIPAIPRSASGLFCGGHIVGAALRQRSPSRPPHGHHGQRRHQSLRRGRVSSTAASGFSHTIPRRLRIRSQATIPACFSFGTAGGYYTNTDDPITVLAQYSARGGPR